FLWMENNTTSGSLEVRTGSGSGSESVPVGAGGESAVIRTRGSIYTSMRHQREEDNLHRSATIATRTTTTATTVTLTPSSPSSSLSSTTTSPSSSASPSSSRRLRFRDFEPSSSSSSSSSWPGAGPEIPLPASHATRTATYAYTTAHTHNYHAKASPPIKDIDVDWVSIDTEVRSLMAQGAAQLAGGNATRAYAKYEQALRRVAKQTDGLSLGGGQGWIADASVAHWWYSAAGCLNNMSVALRRRGLVAQALGFVGTAWSNAVAALAREKRRLTALRIAASDGWLDVVVNNFDLEKDAAWNEASLEADKNLKGKGKANPVDLYYNESGEYDDDDFFAYYASPFDVGSDPEDVLLNSKIIHGPPIIVLFLDLATNFGNILFNLGQTNAAIQKHSQCLRLTECVFEYLPLEADFRLAFPLSTPNRFTTLMTGQVPAPKTQKPNQPPHSVPSSASDPDLNFFPDSNLPNPPVNKRIHLSYLHRSVIVAQSRSLTHLAVCCQSIGLDDSAIQCNSHALEIASFYSRVAIVGGLTPAQQQDLEDLKTRRSESLAAILRADSVNSSSPALSRTETIAGLVNSKKKMLGREEQWIAQEEQEKKSVAIFLRAAVEPVKAAVYNNLAVSCCEFSKQFQRVPKMEKNIVQSEYAKGRIASALELLIKSSDLFKSLNSKMAFTRILASIHAVKIEVGRLLKGIHWVKNMEAQALGQTEIEECARYWGPPRLKDINPSADRDTFAPNSIGEKWVTPGLEGLKECFATFKEHDDLLGMLVAMLNLASGQLINGQPYAALVYMTHLLTESTASGLSLTSNLFSVEPSNTPKVPESLRLHAHFTLCQAVFLLLRIQTTPSEPLYPKYVDWEDGNFSFYNEAEKTTALLEGLNIQIDNFLDLDVLSAAFMASIDDLEKLRKEVINDIPYTLLYPYIGESGFSHSVLAASSFFSGHSDNNANTSTSVVSVPRNELHMYGLGVGMDFLTQQGFLMRAMLGKTDWINATGIYAHSGYNFVISQLRSGIQKLESTVRDAMFILRVETGDLGTTLNNGFIGSLHESSIGPENIPPLSAESIQTSPLFVTTAGGGGVGISRFTAAIQSSTFAVPVLFAISADVMADGAYEMQFPSSGEPGRINNDLLQLLRIPTTPAPSRIHRDLLEASSHAYRSALGMCMHCLREMVKEPDEGGDELVFMSRDGVVVKAVAGVGDGGGEHLVQIPVVAAAAERKEVDVLRHLALLEVEPRGKVHMFPCRHYYVVGTGEPGSVTPAVSAAIAAISAASSAGPTN
ncbi:hypothetical protein HK100_009399, partial [Physocladia obscura]